MSHFCRHCGSPLNHQVIDLGHQPPSNAYLSAEQLAQPEITYPLQLLVCTNCWLVQLPAHTSADDLFTPDYAYFSSTSSSWCVHAEHFVSEAIDRLSLGPKSYVIELASNDGYLLQYIQRHGIPCLGIEPTHATAEAARAKGIPTMECFFGLKVAQGLEHADLVVANNVLAHVPDINDFMSGIASLLKPTGLASIECPHVLKLLQGNQFDTIYHEHYSYLSLHFVERLACHVGLDVVDVEELSTHGGSLRYWLSPKGSSRQRSVSVERVLAKESAAGLEAIEVWSDFTLRAQSAKHQLLNYLLDEKDAGRTVFGYGAAAKGNTLLNFAGIRNDLLSAVADKASSKQGKYLPGSHIPVISPDQLLLQDPQTILVLPWNLLDEVLIEWPGRKLVTAIPEIAIHHPMDP